MTLKFFRLTFAVLMVAGTLSFVGCGDTGGEAVYEGAEDQTQEEMQEAENYMQEMESQMQQREGAPQEPK